jgi:lipocalin
MITGSDRSIVRNQTVARSDLQALIEQAKTLGFDTDKIILPNRIS